MIRPWNEIIAGTTWRPNDGGSYRVIIVSSNKDMVIYRDAIDSSKVWDREPFYFQVRYSEDNE